MGGAVGREGEEVLWHERACFENLWEKGSRAETNAREEDMKAESLPIRTRFNSSFQGRFQDLSMAFNDLSS